MSGSSSSNAFRAQASLDLVNLAKWPASFTYDALVRLSKANVDSATVAAGQATCACFELSFRAQQEIAYRLEKLPRRALYGAVAWFGFGLRHVLDDLADREYGTNCMALCGCLMESYPPFFGAQVLRKLCTLQGAPEGLVPGSLRWQGLLKVTAGTFRASRFSKLVDGFSRLLVPSSRFGVIQRGATDPEALATGLLQLAQISKGKLQDCAFSGGLDCAWLAAVAAFLFNLKTEIRDSNETCLYRYQPLYCLEPSCIESMLPCNHQQTGDADNYRAQVTIFLSETATATAALVSRSYHIPNGRELFRESVLGFQNVVEFHSRSPWDSILQDSFGAAAIDLLQDAPAQHFAGFFAFTAQRADVMRSRDPFVTVDESYTWPNLAFVAQMQEARSSLLEFAIHRLPELKPCLERYLKSRSTTELATEADAVKHVQAIQGYCGCPACIGTQVSVDQFTCLRALSGTLVVYISLLSIASMHKDILPTPYGLRSLYDGSKPLNNRVIGEAPSWRHRWPSHTSDLLRSVFTLFSTSGNTHVISGNFKHALSLAADGLCCYYSILEDPNIRPLDASRVRVIPGHISFNSSMYERIDDLKLEKQPWIPPKPLQPQAFSLYLSESLQEHLLYAAYQAQTRKGYSVSEWHFFSIGSVCSFAASKALQGEARRCGDRVRLLDHRIEVPMGSEEGSSEGEVDPDEWFEETWWIVDLQHPNGGLRDSHPFCNTGEVANYSLLIINASAEICDNLTVFKVSGPSIGDLYAEFAKNYRLPLEHLVHFEIVRIPDCLRCVLSFVADIWPHRTGPQVALPDEVILGQVIVIAPERIDSEVGRNVSNMSQAFQFQLRRDHSAISAPARRRPLLVEFDQKPSPPSPLRSVSSSSMLSTFAKHFKEFVVASTPAELGLERLLQIDLSSGAEVPGFTTHVSDRIGI